MAAASSPAQMKEEFKDEFLTCSICAEPYDNGVHQAKCLPCLHTYCKSCLQRIASKRSQFDCPKCRKPITLPGGTVDSLPNNFLVENLKQYQNIFNMAAVTCGNCNRDVPSVRFCHDCGSFQCQRCTDNHQEMRSMQHHQLVTIEELQAKKCNPITQQLQYYFLRAQMISACEFANQSCDMSHPMHLLTSHSQITERLSELEKEELPEPASDNIDFDFTEIQHSISTKAQIHKSLQDLGDIRWKPQVDPRQCTIRSGLKSGSKQKCKAIIASVDSNGQRMIFGGTNVEATQGGDALRVQDNNDGSYTIDYDSHKGSPLYVKINGTEMNGSPFNTLPQVDPHKCTIQLFFSSLSVYSKAIVQTVDVNGHKMTISNAEVQATQGGRPPCCLKDNNDGTYTILFDSYRGKELHVTINGTEVKGSPFNTLPEVDPQQCTICLKLPGGYHIQRAIVQTVNIRSDKMTTGNEKVEATQDGHLPRVQDNHDGTYTFDYNSNEGSQLLHVKINGTEMKGSPFNTLPQVDPYKCTIKLIPDILVWRNSEAIVQTVDVNGHKMTIILKCRKP
ncbi:tripartite motif-containing protein 2-like [Amphiura filiformis]|uniref:tripartite motif-containing protein 2-like n=1 Tax=Amphiura filiformis TaxID=82378 RepID=UPI003B20BB98